MEYYLSLFLLLLFSNVIFLEAKRFTSYQVIEVGGVKDFENEENFLSTLGLPLDEDGLEILHEDAQLGTVQILVKPDLKERLLQGVKKNQLKLQIIIKDVEALIENSNTFRSEVFDLRGESTFDRYMKHAEIASFLRAIAMKFPHKMMVKNIGESFEGINIQMIIITEQIRRSTTKPKPIIFIEAGAHAREWISISAALYLIDQLARTTSLTKDVEWRIVPVSNPDGYKHSWNKDRLWRKNRRTFSDSSCIGVDLNRNFNSYWGKAGSSSRICSTIYAGKNAFSEPESRAIRDAVLEVKNRTKAYISLHNYGQLILYPPGGQFHKLSPSMNSMLDVVGKKMSNAIFNLTKTEYTVGSPGKMLYPASGLSMDWALFEAKIPLSFTMELRDHGTMGFLLPETEIQETVGEVWSAMKTLYYESKKIKPKTVRDDLTNNQIWDLRELTNNEQDPYLEISLYSSKKEENEKTEESKTNYINLSQSLVEIFLNNSWPRPSSSISAELPITNNQTGQRVTETTTDLATSSSNIPQALPITNNQTGQRATETTTELESLITRTDVPSDNSIAKKREDESKEKEESLPGTENSIVHGSEKNLKFIIS